MDLLEFGMKNKDSKSAVKRTMAKSALELAKKQADLYEEYLERKDIYIPEDPEGDAAMLQRIWEKISEQEKQK